MVKAIFSNFVLIFKTFDVIDLLQIVTEYQIKRILNFIYGVLILNT